MNRKISIGIAISIAAIACAVTFVITMTMSLNNYNNKIADVQQRGEIYTKLQEMDSFVRNYSIMNVDDNAMKTGVYSGYLRGIDDKYARYYNTDEYYYKTQVESGRLIGTGMELSREVGGYILVADVYDGSPAKAEGILKGDVIISVGGTSVLEQGFDKAAASLRYGDEGTKIRFTVRRNGEETDHELIRAAFDIPTVECVTLGNGIMYTRFYAINTSTGGKFSEIFRSTAAAGGITGLVFDMRGCSSGVYSSVSEILDHFLPQTQIASAVYSNNSTRIIAETSDTVASDFTNLPISIIIDERTGGSAELIAEALRDHGAGKTVGENSMGYATLQETKLFSDGTAVEVSVAEIKPFAENSSFIGTGIIPEFTVEYDDEYETDPFNFAETKDTQLRKAIEVILSRAETVPGDMTGEAAQTTSSNQ